MTTVDRIILSALPIVRGTANSCAATENLKKCIIIFQHITNKRRKHSFQMANIRRNNSYQSGFNLIVHLVSKESVQRKGIRVPQNKK